MSQEIKLRQLEITDQSSFKEASAELILAKKELKALKEDMKKLTDPIKESLNGIKAKYEPRMTALESFISDVTKKTVVYQTNLVNAQREAEQAIADRIKPGKGNLSFETGVKKLESVEKAEKKVETEVGSMSFVEYPMCEVEDITQVPIRFYLVDMVAIRAEMKVGNKHPGIRYWTEQRPRNN